MWLCEFTQYDITSNDNDIKYDRIKYNVSRSTEVEGDPKAPFSVPTTPRYRGQ